jgi:hypothetical protein
MSFKVYIGTTSQNKTKQSKKQPKKKKKEQRNLDKINKYSYDNICIVIW